MRRRHGIALAVLFLGVAGCGGDRIVPVHGKVTAKGVALDGAAVQFLPAGGTKGEGGTGIADADGNFSLFQSRTGRNGVSPGAYRVAVRRSVGADGKVLDPDTKTRDRPDMRESVPNPYSSPADTPLKYTVPEAGGEVNIEVPVKIGGRK
jgi:hypothetical protein